VRQSWPLTSEIVSPRGGGEGGRGEGEDEGRGQEGFPPEGNVDRNRGQKKEVKTEEEAGEWETGSREVTGKQ
jgi:hypothetical protein